MSGESTYYFLQFLRMVLPLVPIGLVVIAMMFLCRSRRIRLTFWLRATAVIWLVIAIGNRFMFTWAQGTFSTHDPNGLSRMLTYLLLSDYTWTAESAVFIIFAILLLIYFRRGANAPYGTVR